MCCSSQQRSAVCFVIVVCFLTLIAWSVHTMGNATAYTFEDYFDRCLSSQYDQYVGIPGISLYHETVPVDQIMAPRFGC